MLHVQARLPFVACGYWPFRIALHEAWPVGLIIGREWLVDSISVSAEWTSIQYLNPSNHSNLLCIRVKHVARPLTLRMLRDAH
jgi:hypothetical protein